MLPPSDGFHSPQVLHSCCAPARAEVAPRSACRAGCAVSHRAADDLTPPLVSPGTPETNKVVQGHRGHTDNYIYVKIKDFPTPNYLFPELFHFRLYVILTHVTIQTIEIPKREIHLKLDLIYKIYAF